MLDAKVFLKLLQLDLQSHPPGAPVVKVWLAAEPAEPRRTQSGLFVPVTPEPEKLELTLARIKGAISRQPSAFRSNCAGGDLPVGSPEVLDTHRPDAFRMKKFNPYAVKPQSPSTRAPSALGADDNLDSDAVQSSIGNQQSSLALLAMRVFRPPLAVTVVLHEGRPIKLRTDNDRITSDKSAIGNRQSAILEVVWAAGPWRSSGEWWEEQAWSREEWDVALKADGDVALYRIYRDDGGAWFVEAEYD